MPSCAITCTSEISMRNLTCTLANRFGVHPQRVEVQVVRRDPVLLEHLGQRHRRAVLAPRHDFVGDALELLLDETQQMLLVHRRLREVMMGVRHVRGKNAPNLRAEELRARRQARTARWTCVSTFRML